MASNSPRHDVEPVAISSELNDGASTLTSSAAPSPSPPVDSDDGGGETGSNVDGDPLPTNSFVDDNTGSLRGSIMVSQGRMQSSTTHAQDDSNLPQSYYEPMTRKQSRTIPKSASYRSFLQQRTNNSISTADSAQDGGDNNSEHSVPQSESSEVSFTNHLQTRIEEWSSKTKGFFSKRAVDLIDQSGHAKARHRRRSSIDSTTQRAVDTDLNDVGADGAACPMKSPSDTTASLDEEEWFYYKDFSFYSLKVDSKYPWMRNAGVFSILTTLLFYIFSPILWCHILQDENICPSSESGRYNGWLTSLYFASATMSTVGYGDVTVLVGDDSDNTENWRIFIAVLFMILSLIASVIGLQAGLDSHFHPFRRRLDVFVTRVFEILKDANVIKGTYDKHEDVMSRMRWLKFTQLVEILLIFVALNLVGVFALRLSLLGETEDELGSKLSLSWMESLYWAVQTTTTIGYGDVETPDNFRWFMIIYLSISTYFVGNAIGKLGELNDKLESMRKMYLWEQQEASYEMLADFSGRGSENGDGEFVDVEPEIDQFEFTIASLVLMGKISSADVAPIIEKFKKLTGRNGSKITAADVSGPMKKKEELTDIAITEDSMSKEEPNIPQFPSKPSPSTPNALVVAKKVAQAFREEVLSSTVVQEKEAPTQEVEIVVDYSSFCLPNKTFAIAIDDSKIQRKLLSKYLDFAGIPQDHCTIVGDGRDEIMGFEDFVVNFMESQDDDVVNEDSSRHETISGSLCVESIRKRLPNKLEKRMFALVRSANDSSSDIAIYNARAHGFLPKAPVKRDKVVETLAPMWLKRFPPSEFGMSVAGGKTSNDATSIVPDDIACSPYEISQKLDDIEALFKKDVRVTDVHTIHDQMHELKGDILTLNGNISVTSIVGLINLILVAKTPEMILEKWKALHERVKDIVDSMQKNFCIPKNVFAIAIDDSKIQRKLMEKFFTNAGIPKDQQTILGDGRDEIVGFEDFAVKFIESHLNKDYIFMVVDENLDVENDGPSKHEAISGSLCVENIRRRLSPDAERRVLALVRSANDSTSDVSIYNKRAHGFLPKAPIRREKINETLAPLWMKRFPLSEFGSSGVFDTRDDASSVASDDIACSPRDIKTKLGDIDTLFEKNVHVDNWRKIHDVMHELKGDLLTLHSNASMISILGMINLMMQASNSPDSTLEKWKALRDRIMSLIESLQRGSSQRKIVLQSSLTRRIIRRSSVTRSFTKESSSFMNTFASTSPNNSNDFQTSEVMEETLK
ncbi:predicted protein [Thalassiosira pseudonana CCMP1335]|uniref:Potassium channel domain-containing protein n=1 Tax=Thalassiosira pseudonana TaxID=35128 RepID=B8CCU8_THAPS|nr:predicted protein [Thalassiosira pseudonana CCMP1335]EED88838.1 predicted protein [Thalassiosira pseudonana CCMP1335]